MRARAKGALLNCGHNEVINIRHYVEKLMVRWAVEYLRTKADHYNLGLMKGESVQ